MKRKPMIPITTCLCYLTGLFLLAGCETGEYYVVDDRPASREGGTADPDPAASSPGGDSGEEQEYARKSKMARALLSEIQDLNSEIAEYRQRYDANNVQLRQMVRMRDEKTERLKAIQADLNDLIKEMKAQGIDVSVEGGTGR